MKSVLISLIVLVQVGTRLIINPEYVIGVQATGGSECASEIILNTGTDAGASYSYVCSDWTPAQIIVVLTGSASSIIPPSHE